VLQANAIEEFAKKEAIPVLSHVLTLIGFHVYALSVLQPIFSKGKSLFFAISVGKDLVLTRIFAPRW